VPAGQITLRQTPARALPPPGVQAGDIEGTAGGREIMEIVLSVFIVWLLIGNFYWYNHAQRRSNTIDQLTRENRALISLNNTYRRSLSLIQPVNNTEYNKNWREKIMNLSLINEGSAKSLGKDIEDFIQHPAPNSPK